MKGGAGDGGAGDEDGFEFSDGGENASAADLDGDGLENGFLLLGKEFVGGGPAWGPGAESQSTTFLVFENFDDRAVGAVSECVAFGVDSGDSTAEFFEVVDVDERRVARNVEGLEELGEIVFGFEFWSLVSADAVSEKSEGSLGGALRVELLECSGCGIARVNESGESCFVALFVHSGEGFIGHEDFASDFEELGSPVGELKRDAVDGADVVGDVVACLAVAAGGGVIEGAISVDERDRDAIDLGFDGDGDIFAAEVFLEALVERDEFGVGNVVVFWVELEDVVDGKHRDEVGDLLEAFDGIPADALGGGVGVGELGVFFFEFLEFAEDFVVFGVGDFRGGVGVVEPVVVLEVLTELGDAVFRAGLGEKVVHGAGGF